MEWDGTVPITIPILPISGQGYQTGNQKSRTHVPTNANWTSVFFFLEVTTCSVSHCVISCQAGKNLRWPEGDSTNSTPNSFHLVIHHQLSHCTLRNRSPAMESKFLSVQPTTHHVHVSPPLPPRSCLAPRQNICTSAGPRGAQSSSVLLSSFVSNENERKALFSIPPYNSSKCSKKLRPCLTINSQLNYPIISPQDHWGSWTALFATGAFGIW